MRRPQVDKKGRAVSWSFTEVRLESTLQGSHLKKQCAAFITKNIQIYLSVISNGAQLSCFVRAHWF